MSLYTSSSQSTMNNESKLPKIIKYYRNTARNNNPINDKLSIIKSYDTENTSKETSKIPQKKTEQKSSTNNYKNNILKNKKYNGYVKIGSFEEKLKQELQRVGKQYAKNDSRALFSPTKNSKLYWNNAIDFKTYKDIKELEDRIQRPKRFLKKPRWKPLVTVEKNNIQKLAEKIFNNEKNIIKL